MFDFPCITELEVREAEDLYLRLHSRQYTLSAFKNRQSIAYTFQEAIEEYLSACHAQAGLEKMFMSPNRTYQVDMSLQVNGFRSVVKEMNEIKAITIKNIVHTLSKYGYPLMGKKEQGQAKDVESAIVASLQFSEPRLILGIPVVLFWANGIIDYERLVALSLSAGKGKQMGYLLDVTRSLFSEFSYPIPEELKKAIGLLQKNSHSKTQPFYDSPMDDVYLSYCLKKQDALQKKWNLILNVSYQTFRHKFQQYISHERINEGNSQTSLRRN